jgi:hypothetical protein
MDEKAKDEFLHDLYFNKNFKYGRDKIFHHISKSLENKDISRRYIANWLAKQEVHQLYTARKPQTDIRPIITSRPGAVLQMDLIDYSNKPSNKYKYVLNVIDVFSRKIWLAPITNKSVEAVIPPLDKIVKGIQKDYKINIIQSDAGNEFKIAYPVIKALQSRGYTAQQQGIIEKSNATIKTIINKTLYLTGKNNWSVLLKDIVEIYNNSLHTSIGTTPNLAYKLDKQGQEELYGKMRADKSRQYQGIDTVLEVGQKVRVVVPKEKNKVKGLPNYTEEVYTISKVIKGHKENLTIPRYKLTDEQGRLQKNTYPLSKLLVIPGVE